MRTARTSYLEELESSVLAVSEGKTGSVVNNMVLMRDYTPDLLDDILISLGKSGDEAKAETVMLLANLGVPSVRDEVVSLRDGSTGILRSACEYYLHTVRDPGVLLRMITMRNPHIDLGGDITGR